MTHLADTKVLNVVCEPPGHIGIDTILGACFCTLMPPSPPPNDGSSLGSTRVGSDSTSRRATQTWILKARPIYRDGLSLRFGMDSSSTCLGSTGLGIWRLDPSLFLFERTTVINTFCFLVSLHTTTIKLKDITIIMESKYMH